MNELPSQPGYAPGSDPDARGDVVGLDDIAGIEERSYQVIEQLRASVFAPGKEKVLEVRFSVGDAAAMCKRSTTAIRDAEKAGKLPAPDLSPRGRRLGYTLAQVNAMRRHFGTTPHRNAAIDEILVLGVQNFKGGVGKSTLSAHLVHYLAIQGYRVLAVDCDPQASLTSLFGLNPDFDLEEHHTLVPFLAGESDDLRYAIRPTYFDGVDLIPANLSLYNMEYELAARLQGNAALLDRLRLGIDFIGDDYDIVVIDPPPALGFIPLSVTRAANALIVPVRPATIDFGSTAHFFTMLKEALSALEARGFPAGYRFVRMVANDMDDAKSAHTEITEMMRRVYGRYMLDTVMKDSAEIDNAGGTLMTVYELPRPRTSRQTHNRCRAYLDGVNKEIELAIRRCWPSHRDGLRQEGLL